MPLRSKKSVAVVALLLIIAGAITWYLTRPPLDPLERQRQEDIRVLKDENPQEDAYFGAVTRLAQERLPLARQVAMKWITSPSETMREGSALALGKYDEVEALDTVSKMTEDSSQRVRLAAIAALAGSDSTRRREILSEVSSRPNLGDVEMIAALATQLRNERDPKLKEGVIAKLLRFTESTSNVSSQLAAISELSIVSPRHPVLLTTFRSLAEKADTRIRSIVIRHLGAVGDPWIKANYSKLLASSDAEIKMSVIRSIPKFCPEDRWSLLENMILHERDRTIAEAAFQTAMEMPGTRAQRFFSSLKESGKVPSSETSFIEQGLQSATKPSPAGSCETPEG